MKFDSEFTKAIKALPQEEKDKLIFKLLKHDLTLVNRLHFELLETASVEDKRESLLKKIDAHLTKYSFYSSGYLLMDLRYISGDITQHVKITKDKYGEIVLSCKTLLQALRLFNTSICAEPFGRAYTLCIYVTARVFKLLLLIQTQHKDIHIEFKQDIAELGEYIGQNFHLMRTAVNNGLDVNWLINFTIPDDLTVIHKNLREHGFLK